MTDEEALHYFEHSYFDPDGQGLHQLVHKVSEYWICLNFMLDNHPEWRTTDSKELLREIMKKFQGRLTPQHVTGWIEHIQDKLGK